MIIIVPRYSVKNWIVGSGEYSWNKILSESHKNSVFLFADNATRRGNHGSASIRNVENAVGLLVKKLPCLGKKGAFSKEEEPIVLNEINRTFDDIYARLNKHPVIFIPTFINKEGRRFILDESFCRSTKRFNYKIYKHILFKIQELEKNSTFSDSQLSHL